MMSHWLNNNLDIYSRVKNADRKYSKLGYTFISPGSTFLLKDIPTYYIHQSMHYRHVIMCVLNMVVYVHDRTSIAQLREQP